MGELLALAEAESAEKHEPAWRSRGGLAQREVAVTNRRPWRLADLTFVPAAEGTERAEINGVRIFRRNGRYWIMTNDGPQWSDIDEKSVDSALDFLFQR
jgi:hypothetical protein